MQTIYNFKDSNLRLLLDVRLKKFFKLIEKEIPFQFRVHLDLSKVEPTKSLGVQFSPGILRTNPTGS